MSNFISSVAERIKLKRRLVSKGTDGFCSGFNGGFSTRELGVFEQELLHEVSVVDDQELHEVAVNRGFEAFAQSGSTFPLSLKVRLKVSNTPYESSFDEHGENGSDAEESNAIKERDYTECKGCPVKIRSIHDIYYNNCGTHIYSFPSSNYSDPNHRVATLEEEEKKEEGFDYLDYSPPKKKKKKRVCFGRDERKGKKHYGHKTNFKKKNAKDKVKGCYKYKKFKKGRRKDNGVSVDAILDSIIRKESVCNKEGGDSIPLKFKFDDSEDEVLSQRTNDSNVEGLFEEMDFELQCEEIGSYKTPTVENEDKDDTEASHYTLCQRGKHGDTYLEEQTGMRCRLCGAVVLESRYVIPKLAINMKLEANYAPDKLKSSHLFDEQQMSSSENLYPKDSDSNRHLNIFKKTEGTVWELISKVTQSHLYPHQQEGFNFLWENLAGTTELSRLNSLDSCGGNGGGCIISHAPGTGKTLLTIVFIESFLKQFPNCCPVIIAPASMLLTWESEFKKWQVGLSFINLNSSEYSKKMINNRTRVSKNLIRAIKISSWSKGGSVLGVSYYLYEKLANREKKNLEKMGNVLLGIPGLVILDEGHTPRNQNSKIWNTLLNLETKNRVILSGTPFQNNFKELFNTLRIVRPETATNILKVQEFAHMIYEKNEKTNEDIEKLKTIISPFVHVHKGNILAAKLPGLVQTVVLLSPLPFQKGFIGFIKKLEKFTKTIEYEHKVALVSTHPSLILHCSLNKESKLINKQELESLRLYPEAGVKTRFVMELIRLSVPREKVLVFSQYIKPLELLKDQIASCFGWDVENEVMMIRGMVNQKLRQRIINEFNDPESKVKVLLASTRCCSEGIHLIGASRVVLLDVVWNPSVERQAISRAYRLGQKKVVYTYHLMTAGTSEEEKYDKQVEKGRLAEMVFSSSGERELKNKKNVDALGVNDKILEQMVDHPKLKDMFKEIRYRQN